MNSENRKDGNANEENPSIVISYPEEKESEDVSLEENTKMQRSANTSILSVFQPEEESSIVNSRSNLSI